MDYVLQTNNLTKQYRDFKAVDNLQMQIEKGAIYGLVGRNGAGKTTLIRLLCGLQNPTNGTYTLYGRENTSPEIIEARKRMGAVVESPSIYQELSAEDNIRMQYRILGMPSFDGVNELLSLVGLESTGKKKAKNFSLGMRQRLGIAIAMAGNPDFLILDEPANGLDPQGIIEMRELILKLNHQYQITVLMSSHILDELSKLATHYGFLDSGRMVKEISAEDLEKACRKCMVLTVTDTKILARVLDRLQLQYTILSDEQANVFGEANITELTLALAEEGCKINGIRERDESLESYFVALIGGGCHE